MWSLTIDIYGPDSKFTKLREIENEWMLRPIAKKGQSTIIGTLLLDSVQGNICQTYQGTSNLGPLTISPCVLALGYDLARIYTATILLAPTPFSADLLGVRAYMSNLNS